jgi:transposase
MISIPLSEYNELKTLVVTLSDIAKKQEEENKRLQEQINLLRNGRKSNTSSTPPSHDIGRSNSKNLRIKTGRKSGGQHGHKGVTLEMKEEPDEVIDYKPDYCHNCGTDLQQVDSEITDRKQEVVIPPIQVQYLEHRSHTKKCPICGTCCIGCLPDHLKAPIQYGASVSAMAAYFSVYQYLPYKRMAGLFRDIFSMPISEGSIDNLLGRSAQKALSVYEIIRQKIQGSKVVGGDETGCAVGGKKGWFHTWQNDKLTFIAASLNRGYKTIETYFKDGFVKAVYVSDCWAAQLKTPALRHQLCIAHLLRELTNFEDALFCAWSKEMKQLLQDAIVLKKQLSIADYNATPLSVVQLETRLANLLQQDYTTCHRKVQAFIKRLIKNKESIFTFLYYHDVPPDNNGSERAIRNVKVKTKVSGQFRTEKGANRFAILRSVIDTTIKNSQNVFQALVALEHLVPT